MKPEIRPRQLLMRPHWIRQCGSLEEKAGDKAIVHISTPLMPKYGHECKQQPHHAVLRATAQYEWDRSNHITQT